MSIYKCKMCGGDLNIDADVKVVECDYCGTAQTVPSADNEKKMNLFNRANRLRLTSEFDKAAIIYENIIAEFPEEAEAYWGLCLCNYGIEYVDDHTTAKKVPTCHRASFEKLSEDENFNMAMEYADVVARKVYRDEAREIDCIMENILSISKNEKPYDVFICYKETDEKGDRTIDSVLAQDIYDALTSKGLKVFFARITLEAKLGQMYEPYIFAALNSAKVLISVGTKYEHFHAVWVKNEWSRFLKLTAKDKSKVLIPCYKDMDAYDLPDEFKPLQAQDMGKIGFMQDLARGVEKVLGVDNRYVNSNYVSVNSNVINLVRRGNMALEDNLWDEAKDYFEQALNINVECAEAHVGELLAKLKLSKLDDLKNSVADFTSLREYNYAIRFADLNLKNQLEEIQRFIEKNVLIVKLNAIFKSVGNKKQAEQYQLGIDKMNGANSKEDYLLAANYFAETYGYKNSDNLIEECKRCARVIDSGVNSKSTISLEDSRKCNQKYKGIFSKISDYFIAINSDKTLNFISFHKSQWDVNYDYICKEIGNSNIIDFKIMDSWDTLGLFVLKSNGTVKSTKLVTNKPIFKSSKDNVGDVSVWTDIVDISVGSRHILGLRSDGTVIACGDNKWGYCNVKNWTNIKQVYAGSFNSIGLKHDGTVVSSGTFPNSTFDLKNWKNIVQVAFNDYLCIGVRGDGKIEATGVYNWYKKSKNPFSAWSDIIKVSMNANIVVGLKSNGEVVVVSREDDGLEKVNEWNDIIDVFVALECVVGLRANGQIVVAGKNKMSRSKLLEFKDIVFLSVENYGLIGLKADGTLVYGSTAGPDYYDGGKFDYYSELKKQKLFDDIDSYWKRRNDNVYKYGDGSKYIGSWKNGKFDGNGVLVWKDGKEINGIFKNGAPFNCQGFYRYDNGIYEGGFTNGKRNGLGIYKWDNGDIYEGNYVDGVRTGQGFVKTKLGITYKGEFLNNKKHGQGTYKNVDGSIWEGEFKDNLPWNGRGTWYNSDGTVVKGKWRHGKKVLF